jgi:hypothetical protein
MKIVLAQRDFVCDIRRNTTPMLAERTHMDTFRLMQKRDRLVQQVRDHLDFLAGSISSKGLPWEAYNLTTKVAGITKTRHIPKDLLPVVKRMTLRHKKLKELLKELEQTNWLLIREGEELRYYGTV